MAEDNSALGSALVIPDSVLRKIQEVDDKLQNLQKKAEDTAKGVNSSFGNMTTGANGFINTLDDIITKLGTISQKAQGVNLSNLNTSKTTQEVTRLTGVVTQATESIEKLNASSQKEWHDKGLDNIKKSIQDLLVHLGKAKEDIVTYKEAIGTGKKSYVEWGQTGLKEAEKHAENLMRQIVELDKVYKTLKESAANPNLLIGNSFSKMRNTDELKRMSDYYKLLEKQSAAEAKAAEKAAEKVQEEEERKAKAAEKAAERRKKAWEKASQSTPAYGQQYHNERQAMYNQLFSQSNTTSSMALAHSQSATTLREHVAAIKDLQQARLNLDTTDKNYKKNLETVSEAIRQHSKVLKDAGINTRQLGEQTSYLSTYLSHLTQRAAVTFSVSAIRNFADHLVDVRGQFELSQKSLESIIQNKTKADEIFNKTVDLAIQSPFRIKDLISYTRQLSAYRIESDKLYDTTKRLADVSAGLGVDMGRLILAYGQVKAAAYLRNSEVRQFTEAGVNMYGELQDYFKEVKGQTYSTAEIVDMISKRMVTFEDVEAIFQRMTDKGGMFYNMQRTQADTLYGMVQKFHDAFDVMLNDIGLSHEGLLKGGVSFATKLLNHWKEIANVAQALILILVTLKAKSMFLASTMGKAFIFADGGMAVKLKALWVNTLNSMTKAARAFGVTLKTSLVGLAIYGVIELLTSAVGKYIDYNKAVEKAQESYIKQTKTITQLNTEYSRLVDTMSKAQQIDKKNGNNDAVTKNYADRRKQLQKLIDTASKDGYSINLNVNNIKDTDLDKTFNTTKNKYKRFLIDMRSIEISTASNDWWNTWFTDGLKDNMDDYHKAMVDFLNQQDQIEQALVGYQSHHKEIESTIAQLGKRLDMASKELAKSMQNAWTSIQSPQKASESDAQYIERVYNAMLNLNRMSFNSSWGQQLSKQLIDVGEKMNAVNYAGKNLDKDIDKIFENLSKKIKKNPVEMKARIDTYAAEHRLDEFSKERFYKKYNIKVDLDTDAAQKRAFTLLDQIQEIFDKNKLNLNVNINAVKAGTYSTAVGLLEKDAKTLKEDIDAMTKSKFNYFHGSVFGIYGKQRINGIKGWVDEHTVFTRKRALQILNAQYQKALKENELAGGDPLAKENAKAAKEAEKQQKDILQERINLLKDMNSKYNDFRKTESETLSLKDTRKYFKEAAQNVGWNVDDLFPDDTSVAKKIRDLGATATDVGKRGGYFRIAADIEVKIDEKKYNELTNSINKNIDEAFSELDLYKKLKDSGMSDSIIKDLFGDISKSLDEVGTKINDEFNRYTFEAYIKQYGDKVEKWGQKVVDQYNKDLDNTEEVMKKSGDDINKNYLDKKQKLNEKIKQDTINQFVELTKAYKTQLSEQLQLDRWYVEERNKIQNNEDLQKNPELQKQYLDNLNKKYRQKSDANSWKNFQESDMYIRLFENLEQVSGKALDAMLNKLQSLRGSLKDLDPSQLKTIVDQIKKVEDVRNSKNPFKAFTDGLKEMAKSAKALKELGGVDKYVQLNQQKDSQESILSALNMQTIELQEQYDLEVKLNGADTEKAKNLRNNLTLSKSRVELLKKQVNLTDEQIKKLGSVMTEEEGAKAKFSKSVSDITSTVSAMGQAFSGLLDSLDASTPQISNMLSIFENIGQAVVSYKNKNYMSVATNTINALGGLVNLFAGESRIDKEIERQQRLISQLQHSYSNLKEAMDNAFDIQRLYNYNKESKKELEKELEAYDAMIEAEKERKKPDKSKLQEWEQTKEDIEKSIKELSETMTEQLGGLGTQANYKSAAEAFAEAWVDAFNEGSDALEALDNKFDEYFNNLLKKQLMQRASAKFIEPILKAFDDAVSEGSAGGNNGLEVTKEELENIKALKDKNLAEFDDYAKTFMNILNIKPNGSSNLSNLQQGIQSVTESTAQALESILNSMRYYLATQQADVRIIRDTLLERLGTAISSVAQDSNNSPVLIELRLQTTILGDIRDTLSSCVKGGHKQGRNGIKVFMN